MNQETKLTIMDAATAIVLPTLYAHAIERDDAWINKAKELAKLKAALIIYRDERSYINKDDKVANDN